MTVIVPSAPPVITEAAGQIGAVGSASRLIIPAMDATNHLLGYVMMGQIMQAQYTSGADANGAPAGSSGTGQIMTFVHPNTTAVAVCVRVTQESGEQGGPEFSVTAGTGDTVTREIPSGSDQTFWLAPEWHDDDIGDFGVIAWTATDCDLVMISMWHLHRVTMDGSSGNDTAIERYDPTYVDGGLDAGKWIIKGSSGYNINNGITSRTSSAFTHTRKQAVAWCATGAQASTTSTSYDDVLDPVVWRHRARMLRTGDTSRTYRVYAYTWASDTSEYAWEFSTPLDSVEKTGLSRNGSGNAGWDYVDGFEISCWDGDPELLADNDAEESDMSSWTDVNSNCSKETTTPHGGVRCLRTDDDGSNSRATQTILTANNNYRATGWCRVEDVGADPEIGIGGNQFAIDKDTDWVYYRIENSAGNTTFALRQHTNSKYAEWDDMSVKRIGDDITFKLKRTSGSGTIYVKAIAIIEHIPPEV